MTNLEISVYKMAVDSGYATPWCGWASWKDKTIKNAVIHGMNCERRTWREALRKIVTMVNELDDDERT